MSPKTTAILTIIFAIVISLSILGVFDIPITKNTTLSPTVIPVLKTSPSKSLSIQSNFPRFSPAPIKTPQRTPLTLRLSPTAAPGQTTQPAQAPPPSVFKNFDPLSLEQLFTALDLFGGAPFGGKVLYTQDCDPLFCGGANQLIGVGPPRGGVFAETRSTTLYREFDISVGNWVLGLAGPFEVCWNLVCSFDGCVCVPTGGGAEIEIIGTSK